MVVSLPAFPCTWPPFLRVYTKVEPVTEGPPLPSGLGQQGTLEHPGFHGRKGLPCWAAAHTQPGFPVAKTRAVFLKFTHFFLFMSQDQD